MNTRYIRSNARVVYDDANKNYPQARLQYRVKVFLFFHRWVTVNSSYYTDCWYKPLTPDQIFKNLKQEGQEFKRLKHDRRRFNLAT